MQQNHQIEMSTHEVQSLNENLKALQKQFEAFATTQDRMVTLISGNELDRDDDGMIGELRATKLQMEEIKDDVQKIKAERKSNKKYIAGFVAACTVFWIIIQFIITNILKK